MDGTQGLSMSKATNPKTAPPANGAPAAPPPAPMAILGYVSPAGKLRADCPGWPGAAWAREAAGDRWLAEFTHADDVAPVRAWLGEVFAAPCPIRLWIGESWQTLLLYKVGQAAGWCVTAQPLA